MYPVLFHLGPVTISSFGFFLSIAVLAAVFTSWRLAKAYDLDEEKIIDLSIFTFLGGIILARIFFVIINWSFFGLDNLSKIFLINLYPGFSFWGGLLGGIFTLWFFSRRFKLPFWQIADFAATSFLLALAISDIGCFLGGCYIGSPSDSFLALPVVGVIGKRLPISLFESLILFIIFFQLFKKVIKFHVAGKILALALIYLGLIRLFFQFFRDSGSFILPLLLVLSGIITFYYRSKRNIVEDLKNLVTTPTSPKKRQLVVSSLKKCWYNNWINWKIKFGKFKKLLSNLPRILKRRLNVKSTPKDIIKN
ncbi:MAG: prolipoprotein diacylglyceryl transferase [Candidatus Daviesbacteria bacterium]|nr:prolipoprotein diacylglyceryl transferase [Candidatus Daviesbacteria bacterium]